MTGDYLGAPILAGRYMVILGEVRESTGEVFPKHLEWEDFLGGLWSDEETKPVTKTGSPFMSKALKEAGNVLNR